jgi:signal transduction histidine kinase
MKACWRGKAGGLIAFVLIAGLVAGGLGWATSAAVRLEQEQLDQRAEAEYASRIRLALWRLDGLLSPYLARENTRPFDHYSTLFAPPAAFRANLVACNVGEVLEPSPLLHADLPEWMCLHFQAEAPGRWSSPQVPSADLVKLLGRQKPPVPHPNTTGERRHLLEQLGEDLSAAALLAAARDHAQPATLRDSTLVVRRGVPDAANKDLLPVNPNQQPDQQMSSEFQQRSVQKAQMYNYQQPQRFNKDLAVNNSVDNGANWMQGNPATLVHGTEVLVNLSPLVSLWLPSRVGEDRLLVVRLVRIENREFCQGILLDVPALQELLAQQVQDLFPGARVLPMREREPSQPERTMTALPFQLEPAGEGPAAPPAGWTPLRVGLVLAWAAAGVALLAVALGGWSLIDLSERRIRFVSAVTHELRTPLTTLRLYLDMLVGGMVRDENQRGEYLHTLNAETDRLSRLVGNVLDFSRLESQGPRLERQKVAVADLLAQVRATWEGRCQDAGKELIVESAADGVDLWTDGALLQQVLGNLLDNACKYSRGAEDRRVWLRMRTEGQRLVFEVEDRGPGVPARERRSVFRTFRRGCSADVTAGGVGLGLALARRWTRLLGGRLILADAPPGGGACFRVSLPGRTEGPAGEGSRVAP